MSGAIGWYVHHHGRGHLTRLRAVAPHVGRDIHVFSSLPAPDDLPANCTWTVLPRDDDAVAGERDPRSGDPRVHGMLHWAPLGHRGHRDRFVTIADVVRDRSLRAFVVDVSVEVTLFVRMLGVPVVVIAQPGRRDDLAHRLAYTAAEAIIAPWPRELLEPEHLIPFRDRCVYTGGISRFDGRARVSAGGSGRSGGGVLVLGGHGGSTVGSRQIADAAGASGVPWRSLGAGGAWEDDPWEVLSSADVVVSWAGQNAIADLAAAVAPSVVVPQPRPFEEQVETGRALRRAGLAVVEEEWPAPRAWPELLERAAGLGGDWSRWQVQGGAQRAAAAIDRVAECA